ncbi:MAG: nitric oxide reductase, partial [Nitrosomonadales bacterium]|nr:nitric oxide reductase [Nitrosomonadales bacterium]
MEEFVGGLWHKMVMRAANQRHADAAIRLDEISKTASIFFRAMGGDAGLNLSAAPVTRHGARRRWLERISGTGDKIDLAWRDNETLRLPECVDLFPTRNLNRDLYLWLIALSSVETDISLPWIVRNQHASLEILSRFPGLE